MIEEKDWVAALRSRTASILISIGCRRVATGAGSTNHQLNWCESSFPYHRCEGFKIGAILNLLYVSG